MKEYSFIKIENLLDWDLNHLVEESREEGFRFLERLVNDYREVTNTFSRQGECLFGVKDEGKLIAVGGLNRDPFSGDQHTGRLRRFYVSGDYRRAGIGRALVKRILKEAGVDFDIIVLNTDTEQADQFYRSLGFLKDNKFQNATHYIFLNQKKGD